MRIEHIYLSPGHNFFGRFGQAPGTHATLDVAQVQCVARRGLVGDRFFDYRNDYLGQVTFFSQEVFEALSAHLQVYDKTSDSLRRNIVVSGVDLNALIGREFFVQGLAFEGVEECRPCAWMNQAFAPGAEAFLRGQGGLRARILSSGTLRSDGAIARQLAA